MAAASGVTAPQAHGLHVEAATILVRRRLEIGADRAAAVSRAARESEAPPRRRRRAGATTSPSESSRF